MAQIIESGGHDKKGGKKGRKKAHLPHVDMTPMVDLGFLLLTFFVLTSTFSKPQAMEINMPVPPEDPNKKEDVTKFPEERTLTLLLSEYNTIYWYKGIPDPKTPPTLEKTDFSREGVRKLLLTRNAKAYNMIKKAEQKLIEGSINEDKFREDKKKVLKKVALLVIIKSDDLAKYKNMVDVLDEMQITNVGTYAVVDITKDELEWIAKYKATAVNP